MGTSRSFNADGERIGSRRRLEGRADPARKTKRREPAAGIPLRKLIPNRIAGSHALNLRKNCGSIMSIQLIPRR